MTAPEQELPSTRPYLIRALHEWCVDHGFSPYMAVQVDASVRVPPEFVKNGEIVLNVSPDATSALRLGDEYIEFKARFGGVAREIVVPVTHVIAIYARENGQGMAFPAPVAISPKPSASGDLAEAPASRGSPLRAVPQDQGVTGPTDGESDTPPDATPPAGKRPQLKRIK